MLVLLGILFIYLFFFFWGGVKEICANFISGLGHFEDTEVVSEEQGGVVEINLLCRSWPFSERGWLELPKV